MAFLTKSWKQTRGFMRETLKCLNPKSDKEEPEPSDQLPLLVLQEIFRYLNWPERLKCKRVSKQWKFAIETACPPPLCIYTQAFPCKVKWCFSESEVLSEHAVYCDPEKSPDFSTEIVLYRGLQKLCFFRVGMNRFPRDLDMLSKLKVLMIHHCWTARVGGDVITLNLSSLERFSFKGYAFSFKLFDFNTPNLNSLVVWDESPPNHSMRFKAKFRFPLKIRQLECIRFDSNLSVLRNLETLICQRIACPFTLEDFESLQRLELFPKEEELEYIRGIMKEKRRLRMDSLEIIICGFKDLLTWVEGQAALNSFVLNEHYLREVANHPENLVGSIPWQIALYDFQIFYRIFKEIPEKFIKNIVNFGDIYIEPSRFIRKRKRKSPNAAYVMQLLTQSNPTRVTIYHNFNLQFYEQLVSIQSIEDLNIDESYENLDYDIFLKLRNLNSLQIRTEKLPIEFIAKVFQLKFLRSFIFSYSRFFIIFGLCERNDYYSRDINIYTKNGCPHTLEHFASLEDLIEAMKRLKAENKPFLRGALL